MQMVGKARVFWSLYNRVSQRANRFAEDGGAWPAAGMVLSPNRSVIRETDYVRMFVGVDWKVGLLIARVPS
jgi:hypothetical protein